MAREPLINLDLPLPLFREGKVRKVYDLGSDRLLIVSTDRISAYDVVMKNGIPGKGIVLNTISAHFFRSTGWLVENHFLTDNVADYPSMLVPHLHLLRGRSMIVRKTIPIPVECVVRADLLGSALAEYEEKGTVCGQPMPRGLKKGDRLPAPIFTPATKAEYGDHDENISVERMAEIVGPELTGSLAQMSLSLYTVAANLAALRGIRVSDTKYEFGLYQYTRLIQIDESHTPDSSRYVPDYSKQPVRDYLDSIRFDRKTPIDLPPDVVAATSRDYAKGCEILTGIHV